MDNNSYKFKDAVIALETLKNIEIYDYDNCKDQHHLLETHVNFHKTIEEINNVIEILNKNIELEEGG
tara:strand:+ start:321 stop:521 length:201 start_codon:yes stop_codon:yes gene_type:complete